MKSKRLLSLAMAAVMSMSALSYCASIKTPVGIVANAEVTYSSSGTQIPIYHIQAKVTYSQDEIDKMWKKGNLQRRFDREISNPSNPSEKWTLYTWDKKEVTDEYKRIFNNDVGAYVYRDSSGGKHELTADLANTSYYGVRFSYLNLKSQSSKNTTFRKYYGWVQLDDANEYVSKEQYESNKSSMSDYFVELDENDTNETAKTKVDNGIKKYGSGLPRCKSSSTICQFSKDASGNYVAAFQTTGTSIAESDEAIYADLERQAEEAAEKKAENKKNDYVSGKQSKWNGWNNVYDTKEMQKTSRILYIDENNTGKEGVQYIPPKGKGIYSESDVEGLKKICGVTDVEKAYVFEIHIPSRYELIDGKNMVVRLDLDHKAIGANTDGYNVYLYHMVDGKAKRVRKIGWRMYYVVFAANSFSPYVLVLTPKDQKRGVASTGAVLYANPPTGEGDVVPVAMLAASALGMSCLLTVRKRKEQEV